MNTHSRIRITAVEIVNLIETKGLTMHEAITALKKAKSILRNEPEKAVLENYETR